MRLATPIVRPVIIIVVICASAFFMGGLRLPLAEAQVTPAPPAPGDVDMTPFEQSPEVQELLKGKTLVPDPGEPAGAIKAYLATNEKVRTAMRRIRIGLLPEETDFDPDQLLNEVLVVRQEAAARYPMSRHALQGLGEVFWFKYLWAQRAADLRKAIDAYTAASRISMRNAANIDKHFVPTLRQIAGGFVALSDVRGLDAFFGSLRGTEFWPFARLPYAMALGSLNDQRADQLFQEELALMPPGQTVLDYVGYLWDQKRYQDALRVFDRKPTARLWAAERAMRGAILEQLGRLDEARAEYKFYFDEAAKASFISFLAVPGLFQIPGSTLQRDMRFSPSSDKLPQPQSGLSEPSLKAMIRADRRSTPCVADDWFCKAEWYLLWTIHGETGCVATAPTCRGTWGGQRAVAWNIRNRVFNGPVTRVCSGQTQTCAPDYAYGRAPYAALLSLAQ